MSAHVSPSDRRGFIGGSDARIIMGNDEEALLRLWREKRGEEEPEDLSGNLIVQLGVVTEDLNRHWYERNTGPRGHRGAALCAASGEPLDGGDPRRDGRGQRGGVRGQVHAALDVLGGSSGREAHGAAPAQHVGHQRQDRGALDHHRRRQVGRDDGPGRPPLPASADHRGEEVLALCGERGAAAGVRDRATPATHWRRCGSST